MRKRKTIIIRDPKLRRIRNNLREVLIHEIVKREEKIFARKKKILYDEIGRFHDLNDKENNEVQRLNLEFRDYVFLLRDSICFCQGCRAADKDMSYNPTLKKWYCIDCCKEFQEEYKERRPFRIQEDDWDWNTEIFYRSFF